MKTVEYQKAASRTICPQNDITNKEVIQMLHCVVGMMGELGELASCLEKHIWYGQELDVVNFNEELGDTCWYVAEGASATKTRLEDILEKNIAKLKKRFPQKYDAELVKEENRDREAERKILDDQDS